MTTLEGYDIVSHLHKNRLGISLEKITLSASDRRFKPTVSTNAYAAACLRGEDFPDEASGFSGSDCQFLSNNTCKIYKVRPFGCRCFFSKVRCSKEAAAVVDPFLVTLNTIFLQCIEHVDSGGRFGNIYDVIAFLVQKDSRMTFLQSPSHQKPCTIDPGKSISLARNKAIPALMIPPEHRERSKPIVDALRRILDGHGYR
jgi:Fe-S-cluster containining protein